MPFRALIKLSFLLLASIFRLPVIFCTSSESAKEEFQKTSKPLESESTFQKKGWRSVTIFWETRKKRSRSMHKSPKTMLRHMAENARLDPASDQISTIRYWICRSTILLLNFTAVILSCRF